VRPVLCGSRFPVAQAVEQVALGESRGIVRILVGQGIDQLQACFVVATEILLSNVRVLASVDEGTYSDPAAVRMGDHPVIWTNERMAARNVYIFMGHGPWLFEDKAFTTIFRNAILWAAEKQPSAKSK